MSYDLGQSPLMKEHLRFAGLDVGLESQRSSDRVLARVVFAHGILTDVEPEEVKPDLSLVFVQRVRDPSFAGFQLQPHALEPFLDDSLTLSDHFQITVADDKSSSPGELHPQALTDPDVRLSPHPALMIRSMA